jgi:predicted porin
MKISHLAAASLLALAGGAQAQASSVQLFGTLDLGVGSFKSLGVGVNAGNTNNRQVVNGAMSTSLFGLRGTEDLGGGLTASFELASFIRADSGAVGRNDAVGPPVNVAADPFWSRQAWVGLTSTGFGRLRLGNSSSLLFVNSISSNAFGDSTVVSPLNVVTFIGSPLSGGTGWTNQIIYDTPRLGGLVLSAAVSASEGQGGRNHALRAAYSDGPLALSAVMQKVDKNPLTFADGTSPNNTRAWQLGASYDFNVVKVWAHLGQIDNRGTETAPLDIGYRIVELSAAVPVGAGRVLAAYAQRKTDDAVGPVPATAAGGNIERKVLTLGYDHDLSKRTDVYAVVMSDRTLTSTLPAPPRAVSASAGNFAVGLRHRF